MKQAGYAQLYMKNKRDTIIAYGLSHKMKIGDAAHGAAPPMQLDKC